MPDMKQFRRGDNQIDLRLQIHFLKATDWQPKDKAFNLFKQRTLLLD